MFVFLYLFLWLFILKLSTWKKMLRKIPRAELVDFVIAVNADDGLQKASTVTF